MKKHGLRIINGGQNEEVVSTHPKTRFDKLANKPLIITPEIAEIGQQIVYCFALDPNIVEYARTHIAVFIKSRISQLLIYQRDEIETLESVNATDAQISRSIIDGKKDILATIEKELRAILIGILTCHKNSGTENPLVPLSLFMPISDILITGNITNSGNANLPPQISNRYGRI